MKKSVKKNKSAFIKNIVFNRMAKIANGEKFKTLCCGSGPVCR